MKIITKNYDWARQLVRRNGAPPGIVWHNQAGLGSSDSIHAYHRYTLGWSGIAYHFHVRTDGRIYRGRPEWAMGGHCLGHNDWIGVCAEGNYDKTKVMPEKQLAALRWLHGYLHKKYKGAKDRRHRDMPGNSTSCPGKYFPFKQVTK